MKKTQYPHDLILSADIMKHYRHNDSVKIKTEHKTSKYENFKKHNKC